MNVPAVVEHLDHLWGQHQDGGYNDVPGRAWRSWSWRPSVLKHGGPHTLSVGLQPGTKMWEVQVGGGACCPMESSIVRFRNEPTDLQVSQIVGTVFGLYDDVIYHHLRALLTRSAHQVRHELHREARYQEEMSRSGVLRPGYRSHEIHTYARDRMLEIEGAIRAMTAEALTPERMREKMDLVRRDPGPVIPQEVTSD